MEFVGVWTTSYTTQVVQVRLLLRVAQCTCTSVMPEPGWGATAPPIFGRSVNPIPTMGGRFCPPFTRGTPNVFHLPASLHMYSVSHLYYPVYIMERKMQYCWDNNYRTPCTYRRGLSWTMESFGYLVLIWSCWPQISANPTYRLINIFMICTYCTSVARSECHYILLKIQRNSLIIDKVWLQNTITLQIIS